MLQSLLFLFVWPLDKRCLSSRWLRWINLAAWLLGVWIVWVIVLLCRLLLFQGHLSWLLLLWELRKFIWLLILLFLKRWFLLIIMSGCRCHLLRCTMRELLVEEQHIIINERLLVLRVLLLMYSILRILIVRIICIAIVIRLISILLLLWVTRKLLWRYNMSLNLRNIWLIRRLLFFDLDLWHSTLIFIFFFGFLLCFMRGINLDLLEYGIRVRYSETLLLWLNLLRRLFLLYLLLNYNFVLGLLRCLRRSFEVKLLGSDFIEGSHNFSKPILGESLVVASEFLSWICELIVLMLRNAEYHVGIVCLEASIVERRKR